MSVSKIVMMIIIIIIMIIIIIIIIIIIGVRGLAKVQSISPSIFSCP